ncbi:MAG TPA: hypothetical protein VLT36_19525 [Candidatus Dormibacteraeota bacterium]|nr:hypothetical protein [Candidatus Dormibacteraeota bacterium]
MKNFWTNLRPLEKRLVFGVVVFVLVLANFWIIVPHFSDWSKVQERMLKAQETKALFENEIKHKRELEDAVKKYEGAGLAVPPEEQATHFIGAVNNQAVETGVTIMNTGKQQTKTNLFFLESTVPITVQAKEQQLVDFLYNLGSGNSLIRVRGLRLHPDPPRQQLQGDVTLVASYQKKVPVRAAAPAAGTKSGASTPIKGPTTTRKPATDNKPSAPTGAKSVVPTNRPGLSNTKKP